MERAPPKEEETLVQSQQLNSQDVGLTAPRASGNILEGNVAHLAQALYFTGEDTEA